MANEFQRGQCSEEHSGPRQQHRPPQHSDVPYMRHMKAGEEAPDYGALGGTGALAAPKPASPSETCWPTAGAHSPRAERGQGRVLAERDKTQGATAGTGMVELIGPPECSPTPRVWGGQGSQPWHGSAQVSIRLCCSVRTIRTCGVFFSNCSALMIYLKPQQRRRKYPKTTTATHELYGKASVTRQKHR